MLKRPLRSAPALAVPVAPSPTLSVYVIRCVLRAGLLGGLVSVLAVPAAGQDAPDRHWSLVQVPQAWRQVPQGDLAPEHGYSWYRCLVRIPESWRDKPVMLYVEALDDVRATYVNGVTVGATGTFPPRYRSGLGAEGRYEIPAERLRFGESNPNTIAIRVYQEDPRPNFQVAPPVLLNEEDSQAIRADGHWQYRPGDDKSWSEATLESFANNAGAGDQRELGIYAKIDAVDDIPRYISWRDGDDEPLSPEAAERSFRVPDDLQFQRVLSEPHVAQPLFLNWDQRGRLWVVEYRQYPNPAGLKMVSRDVYLRTVYDKVPTAPPNHVHGRDRISIHEDIDGDGMYDEHKVFVDGLNIATSMAIGRGGVWVTNPPYLLFYPDRNGDDIPDGDPEVHLEGFGLEDTHSVINSLRFGPDGWLYAAQGSTVSAQVRRPGSAEAPVRTMGQQIWRYHPELRQFEVFAEGGGNTFGVEIDAKGRVYSGHNGGDTRGFHYVQGSYSRKGFDKHGSLSNPFAFGYFEPMKHHSVPRFTHNFVLYEADTLPKQYQGRLFGIEPLQGQVVMSSFDPDQSTFQTRDISRPVTTDDPWFRPVDIKIGPDGCIYVADMYEQRIDHSSHYAGRVDRTNGRVYRLMPNAPIESAKFDYGRQSSTELLGVLRHANKWHRQTVQRLLGDRKDETLSARIVASLNATDGQDALELLWALRQSGELDDDVTEKLLAHDDKFVRSWTVRFIGDRRTASAKLAAALANLAAVEGAIEVREQLAASAQRLSPTAAVPILRNLIGHDADAEDIHQPLMVWWALEKQISNGGDEVIGQQIVADQALWHRPLMQQHLIERLMKRYAMPGTQKGLLDAAGLLETAPDDASRKRLLDAFEQAYQGRSLVNMPPRLVTAIRAAGGGSMALRLRQGERAAIQQATAFIADDEVKLDERVQYVQILGELRRAELLPVLTQLATPDQNETLAATALNALQALDDPKIASLIIERFSGFRGEAKVAAESLLASRQAWTRALLQAIDAGTLAKQELSEAGIRKLLLHEDTQVQRLVEKHWGTVSGATTDQMRQEIARIQAVIYGAAGNPKKGKPLFMQQCGKCHRLFGEGGDIGPDLTSFQRSDLDRALLNVVNPSAEIREGFENHLLVTQDGQIASGFLADQDSQILVLRDVDGRNHVFQRDEIESQRALPVSVMPEGTLRELTDQQLRDLFAYLRSSQPVNY